MDDGQVADAHFTLVGLKPDGVAPFIDILVSQDVAAAVQRAEDLLRDHASCASVEVWRGAEVLEVVRRS